MRESMGYRPGRGWHSPGVAAGLCPRRLGLRRRPAVERRCRPALDAQKHGVFYLHNPAQWVTIDPG